MDLQPTGTWWKVETATKPVARKPVNPKFKNSRKCWKTMPAPPHLILPPGVKRPEEQVAKRMKTLKIKS